MTSVSLDMCMCAKVYAYVVISTYVQISELLIAIAAHCDLLSLLLANAHLK